MIINTKYKFSPSFEDKQNFIELKTLEFCFKWDKELSRNIFNIRHKLNSYWFEKYIEYVLNNYWFKIHNTKSNKNSISDWWIDLEWYVNNKKVYVQCKKYYERDDLYNWKIKSYNWRVWVKKIRDFFWWIKIKDNSINLNNSYRVFVTTWSFTSSAKTIAKGKNVWVELMDYNDIAEFTKMYSLRDFINDYSLKEWDVSNILWKSYNQTNLIEFSFKDLLEEDLVRFWKNIRNHLAENNTSNKNLLWLIKNDTINKLAYNRVSNIEWLNRFIMHCSDYNEKINLINNKEYIIRWLSLINEF